MKVRQSSYPKCHHGQEYISLNIDGFKGLLSQGGSNVEHMEADLTHSATFGAGTDGALAWIASRLSSVSGDVTSSGCVCGNAVCIDSLDETQLSDGSLRSRLGLIGRSESRLAAMKSRVLAEVGRRHSAAIAQRVAGEELRSSGREAKRDVEAAQRMSGLPVTSEALDDGSIPQGHARLISQAAGEGDIDESALVDAARSQDYDEFVKTVRRHQQDLSADDGQSILDRQRTRRKATIFESSETGMFVLSAQLDRITGSSRFRGE